MTEVLESTQQINNSGESTDDFELDTFEADRMYFLRRAIGGRTIQLDLRHDNSFSQSKIPEEFTD